MQVAPPSLHEESSDSSSDEDDDIITVPPKVPSGKSTPAQSKRTTKQPKVASTSVLTSVPTKTASMPNSTVLTSTSTSNIKRTSNEKKDLFTDSESSSSNEDPLSSGIPKPVAMDARTGRTHKGKAKLEDLFDEPSMEGLLLRKNEEESSSEDSTGVTLSSVGVDMSEAVISGTVLEQFNKVGRGDYVNNILDCTRTCVSIVVYNYCYISIATFIDKWDHSGFFP